MSFPRYQSYKDSSVEWLGEVPEHWKEKPLKTVTSINDEVLSESVSTDHEIEYVDISSVSLMNGIERTESMIFGDAPSRARRIPRNGDVLVSTVRTYLKAIAPVVSPPSNLVASTGFAVVRPQLGIHPGYLKYALQEEHFIQQVISRSTGVSYPAINASDIARIRLSLPNQFEQLAIAAFLDRETAKIDALIIEQQRLIELLQEKRQAVISHAVTKGLNPVAPMKDSGVEWLEQVPKHWRLLRGRFLFRKREEAVRESDEVVTAFRDGQVIQRGLRRTDGFTLADLEVGYQHVCVGDLVIHGMDAFAGAIGVSESDGKCTPEYSVCFPIKEGVSNCYFAHALRIMAKRDFIYVICPSVRERAPRFRFTTFKDVVLPVPPLEEQSQIEETLDRECSAISGLLENAENLIQILQERRSALISAAVTGQIDVRGLAPETSAA
jgi:type I restriction enzyme S subunit